MLVQVGGVRWSTSVLRVLVHRRGNASVRLACGRGKGRERGPTRRAREKVMALATRPVAWTQRNGKKDRPWRSPSSTSAPTPSSSSASTRSRWTARTRDTHVVRARETTRERWWEKDCPNNMKDIHSTQEFVDALADAGEKLVIVDFFATWCGACRALFPKVVEIAKEHEDIVVLKVNFDENKPMCKSLGIKVLPFFHFYRGASGKLAAFSASMSKLKRLEDAVSIHNTARCSLGPPPALQEFPDVAPAKEAEHAS